MTIFATCLTVAYGSWWWISIYGPYKCSPTHPSFAPLGAMPLPVAPRPPVRRPRSIRYPPHTVWFKANLCIDVLRWTAVSLSWAQALFFYKVQVAPLASPLRPCPPRL